jgi:hypothetical protein
MAKRKKLGFVRRSPLGAQNHIVTSDGIITVERERNGNIRIIAPPQVKILPLRLTKTPPSGSTT